LKLHRKRNDFVSVADAEASGLHNGAEHGRPDQLAFWRSAKKPGAPSPRWVSTASK
jgi:hypothetical protein